MRFHSTILALPLALATGCSTIVHVNRPSGLSVKGSPSGASILVDGVPRGYTAAAPVQIAVEGNSGTHVVRLEKKGYVPREFTVEKSMSNWVWGNAPLAVFPLVAAAGVGVDATCGSWYTLTPGEIKVTLSPVSPVVETPPDGQTPAEAPAEAPAEDPTEEASDEAAAPEGQTPAEAPAEAPADAPTEEAPDAETSPEGQTPPALDENGLVPPPVPADAVEESLLPDTPPSVPADDDLAPPPIG